MRRRRFRKWAKWACTVAAGALLGLWVLSVFWDCGNETLTAGGNTLWTRGMGGGSAHVGKWDGLLGSGVNVSPGWRSRWNNLRAWGFWAEFLRGAGGLRWFPGIHYDTGPAGWVLTINLVYPALLTSIPAGWLWYADRRRFRSGACGGCGYDRRGLAADAKCPECGTAPARG